LNKAATELGRVFEKEHGISVQYNFGGSHNLLAQIQLVKKGDVFIPGEDYYLKIASDKGLIESSREITPHIPVIAVPKGNPKHIASLEDLGDENTRIGLGDPQGTAIGKTTLEILKKNNLELSIKKNVVTYTTTVNELVAFLGLKQIDAAVIWEDNALSARDTVDFIAIPGNMNIIGTIRAGILTLSTQKHEAKLFIDFLSSPKAKRILERYGFKTF